MSESMKDERIVNRIPVPMCVVDPNGKIKDFNGMINQVFIYDDIRDYDFFALTGIRIDDLIAAAQNDLAQTIERNDRIFRLQATLPEDENGGIYVFFMDITDYEVLKKRYRDEKVCVARVNIDNFDEMKANTEPDMRMTITSQVDKDIRKWAAKISGSIVIVSNSEYIIYFQQEYMDEMIRAKFGILDEVREIETEADFPMSLSIGIGVGGSNISETRNFADVALDLAMGRGGDQAVVKNGTKIEYFGGKLQTVEKGNKGKSRVVSHALSRLIESAPKIMIMGHRNPDMDAFGSALGMFRICQMNSRNASIVVNEVNDSLQTLYRSAKESGLYTFLDNEEAIQKIDSSTLLIVLDTHRPSYVQCRELLEKTDHIAVIDHHRRAVDAIQNPSLSYIESYASSTAELITEILQYTGSKKDMEKLEAEALLAGMTVDTNRFAVKTGVRTFEAAAWLRRAGADTTEVKRLFQTNMSDFKVRAEAVANATIREDGIATSTCLGFNEEAQVINSQVADELLNVKGVRASFVAGRDETGQTAVSARSLGDINVQIIMEKIGGGGHLTTAGAQTEESPEDAIQMILSILESAKESEEK